MVARTTAWVKRENRQVRYGVVGLGYIAQIAVLPAFRNAARNSSLAALVSDDAVKLRKLGRKYGVKALYNYEQYDAMLAGGEIDAVYIALPNHMHHEYTVRAARAGVHVLCEKPMAVTEDECHEMLEACRQNSVKLMIAYRLHFEEANLRAVELVNSGRLGQPRLFDSIFTMQVKDPNIRLEADKGGGTLYDIGIYCINAARSLFRAEPQEVFATSASSGEPRFAEVDEMTSAIMRFPGERLAAFTSSFGSSDVSAYQVVCTKGDLRVDPAYEIAQTLKHRITIEGRAREKSFRRRDQFGPELLYFSGCILRDEQPEPSGEEGLADVRVIRALYESAATGQPVKLPPFVKPQRPTMEQEIRRPALRKPRLVHAESPHP